MFLCIYINEEGNCVLNIGGLNLKKFEKYENMN